MRRCPSPTTHVTTYKEYEGSPEQLKVLGSSQTDTQASQKQTGDLNTGDLLFSLLASRWKNVIFVML